MSRILPLLAGATGLLFVVSLPWGIFRVFSDTRHLHGIRKFLWRVVAVGAPLGGFLLFAFSRSGRRDEAGEKKAVAWRPVTAHLVLLALGFSGLWMAQGAAVLRVGDRQPRDYSAEWWYAASPNGHPGVCLAMSGGGIRSAAFNIGVLRGLHETGLLKRVDVMSAVSGGSYALSWFLLQQYYVRQAVGLALEGDPLLDRMFDPAGTAQRHLASTARQFGAIDSSSYYFEAGLTGASSAVGFNLLRATSWITQDENRTNAANVARGAYRESLQRTFQQLLHPETGALLNSYRPSVVETATNMDLTRVTKVHFLDLARFARANNLPFFVFNTTVLVDAAHRLADASQPSVLWPTVFELNGWGLGSDSYGYRAWTDIDGRDPRFEAVRLVNVAPAISGAAVSPLAAAPGSGARTALMAANVDLGYLVPRFKPGDRGSLYLTDGGHSENLGVYSLARRGCGSLIVVDAEEESSERYVFSGYQHVRKVLRDEMQLALRVPAIDESRFEHADPVLCGSIGPLEAHVQDPGQPQPCRVAYIKLAMDKTRASEYPESVRDPRLGKAFPQDPTANQNFGPHQYEAYRDLGYWIATRSKTLREFGQALASAR